MRFTLALFASLMAGTAFADSIAVLLPSAGFLQELSFGIKVIYPPEDLMKT